MSPSKVAAGIIRMPSILQAGRQVDVSLIVTLAFVDFAFEWDVKVDLIGIRDCAVYIFGCDIASIDEQSCGSSISGSVDALILQVSLSIA